MFPQATAKPTTSIVGISFSHSRFCLCRSCEDVHTSRSVRTKTDMHGVFGSLRTCVGTLVDVSMSGSVPLCASFLVLFHSLPRTVVEETLYDTERHDLVVIILTLPFLLNHLLLASLLGLCEHVATPETILKLRFVSTLENMRTCHCKTVKRCVKAIRRPTNSCSISGRGGSCAPFDRHQFCAELVWDKKAMKSTLGFWARRSALAGDMVTIDRIQVEDRVKRSTYRNTWVTPLIAAAHGPGPSGRNRKSTAGQWIRIGKERRGRWKWRREGTVRITHPVAPQCDIG